MPSLMAPRAPAPLARLRETLASMGEDNERNAPCQSRTLIFGTTFRVCAVCLEEYRVGDSLRVLDACGHCFHARCIDAWVSRRPCCPVCQVALPPPPNKVPKKDDTISNDAPHTPRVQLIDLSVNDSWLDWILRIVNRRIAPQDHPPLSLAVPLT